jgi:hypothetical protein
MFDMHVIASLAPLIVMLNWLAGIIVFERLHAQGFFLRVFPTYDKPQCCKGWVIGETFVYLLCGFPAFMLALLMLWTIGASHYFLCADDKRVTIIGVIRNVPSALKKVAAYNNGVITVAEMLDNIRVALRQAICGIKRFLK